MTQTITLWNETGGVGKTTSAVSLAMLGAIRGLNTVLVDLDPRAASTKWIGAVPEDEGMHVGAILADPAPEGWGEELALPTTWHDNLRIIPSDRSVAHREAERPDGGEVRLRAALRGTTADFVVIDAPNRQGGLLPMNALMASDAVIYAATASEDGVDGIDGASETLAAFARSQQLRGSSLIPLELGVILTSVSDTIQPKVEKRSIDYVLEQGIGLTPFVPKREAVRQSRFKGEWYGNAGYERADIVVNAYDQLLTTILERTPHHDD